MNDKLSVDEYDALAQISKSNKRDRPTACVARNSKRLSGLKYATYGKDGHLSVTEKGREVLFLKECIEGLRALSVDPMAVLRPDVANFLAKKDHVRARSDGKGFDVTQKGGESLADIDAANR